MSDGFGSKARKFMGWYTPEDGEEDLAAYEETPDIAPVSELVTPEAPRNPLRREAPREEADLSRIVTVHPGSYSDALPIGENFRKGIPVIVNLTDMSDTEARRVVDFAAGLTFALHGVIERVTSRVFLLSPRTVEVSGDVTGARRGGLFNQG